MLHCHGLGCSKTTDFANAHLIPQAFAREMQKRSGGVANTTASELWFNRRLPHGPSDNEILCRDCDHFLGRKYDGPAFELINALRAMDLARPTFEVPNVNGDLLCMFVLSILWRCSISKRYEVSNIDLGGYTNSTRAALWGALPLSDLCAYRLMLQRYYPTRRAEAVYSVPIQAGIELGVATWHAYTFPLVGFRFLAILDSGPLPATYDQFILNGSTIWRGSFVDYETTCEAEQARSVLALHGKA
jgi:hypothetical protein